MKQVSQIESFRNEYLSLPENEWRRDYFDEATGGYVATHVLKDKDDLTVPGIKAEANACVTLAKQGKRILRLPENVFNMIDSIIIAGKKYHDLLKYNKNEKNHAVIPMFISMVKHGISKNRVTVTQTL